MQTLTTPNVCRTHSHTLTAHQVFFLCVFPQCLLVAVKCTVGGIMVVWREEGSLERGSSVKRLVVHVDPVSSAWSTTSFIEHARPY
jgi:hypothetical protein